MLMPGGFQSTEPDLQMPNHPQELQAIWQVGAWDQK